VYSNVTYFLLLSNNVDLDCLYYYSIITLEYVLLFIIDLGNLLYRLLHIYYVKAMSLQGTIWSQY
jgi:hypothetical protein